MVNTEQLSLTQPVDSPIRNPGFPGTGINNPTVQRSNSCCRPFPQFGTIKGIRNGRIESFPIAAQLRAEEAIPAAAIRLAGRL